MLKWIVDYVCDRAAAEEIPIGWIPRFDEIDLV
jgi:GTP-dependent phosphoenolpyruvate carboxykinase